MAKHSLSRKIAREVQLEAEQIANGLKAPGQTKEQTRLIARGIQRGIETYRRKQAEKARDFDKELKKLKKQENAAEVGENSVEDSVLYRQHWLPWTLFGISLAAHLYLVLTGWVP